MEIQISTSGMNYEFISSWPNKGKHGSDVNQAQQVLSLQTSNGPECD